MKASRIRFVRDTRGQSLIEFALILPMMLAVMFMITEFGRALYMYNVLENAARAGARAAVVSGSGAAIANGKKVMGDLLKASNMDTGATLDITVTDNYQSSGVKVVTATATRPFTWAFAGPLSVNPNAGAATVSPSSLTLKGQAIMKTETF